MTIIFLILRPPVPLPPGTSACRRLGGGGAWKSKSPHFQPSPPMPSSRALGIPIARKSYVLIIYHFLLVEGKPLKSSPFSGELRSLDRLAATHRHAVAWTCPATRPCHSLELIVDVVNLVIVSVQEECQVKDYLSAGSKCSQPSHLPPHVPDVAGNPAAGFMLASTSTPQQSRTGPSRGLLCLSLQHPFSSN